VCWCLRHDAEAEEFLSALRAFIGQVLDDYFREEFEPDDL